MILDDISDKLNELKPNKVFYGLINKELEEWDYIVFSRGVVTPTRTGYSRTFQVAVVEENYITENYEKTVIEKVTELAGLHATGDIEFQYVRKPNTDIVIEIMIINFVQAIKDLNGFGRVI